jgi:hypothetical protein
MTEMMVEVDLEVRRLAATLYRAEWSAGHGRVMQRCAICNVALSLDVAKRRVDAAQLRAALFALYDEHACDREISAAFATADALDELFVRLETAMLAAAERAQVVADPQLRARAEVESELFARRGRALRDIQPFLPRGHAKSAA